MKKFLSVLLMVAGLMSCGDDDKPFIPELNKLTSVTCTKNGNAFFNANITYDQDKQINRIILNTEGNQFTDNYIIVDKTISVSGVKMIDGSPTDPFVHTVYTLSGNMIAAKEEKSENKYMSNAVYTAVYNPQIQISAESETKRSIFREKDKTKRSKKESAQHSKSRNKSFVMTSVSAL